ncbi:sucrose-6-phosphate hydrolase [Amyelois transitella]|uniref:sucrose-6-phosphate hydrolase n=1 Tax=Amyelois transitella TaxID=680683 RepID=UPI00067B0FCB|nr:sucrose-6-phosphate hydrolase [Amyelois transitella]
MEALPLIVWLALVAVICYEAHENVDEFMEQNKVLRFTYRKKYRPAYHISAPMGWLNAPSGFVHFKQEYHIFYQYYPYNGAWGTMRWGHVVSKNLVDWYYASPALIPKEYYELHGCFSGSAVVENEYLTLFYTGVRIMFNITTRTQNIAVSTDGVYFEKHLHNPIIRKNRDDARNPKVWKFRNNWYMVLASTSRTGTPRITLYISEDLFNWNYNGTIVESLGDMGTLWEHPDFFEMEGQYVLTFTVRGLVPDIDRFKNIYHTGYVLGKFNYLTAKFEDVEISMATFNELDYGHDFYAAHSMQALDGRRLMVGWLGMWQSDFEELRDGWAGMLTLIREVSLSENEKILLQPLREIVDLRLELLESAFYHPGETFQAGTKYFELLLNASTTINDVGLTFDWGGDKQFVIKYLSKRGQILIDRGGTDGVRRADWVPDRQIFWRIFMDSSSVELYCGEGEVVFTSRIYPKKGLIVKIEGEQMVHIVQHKLRRSVSYSEHLREHLREMHELTLQNNVDNRKFNGFCK